MKSFSCGAAGLLSLVMGATTGCRPATQVTFDLTTDVPCDRVQGTSISVGIDVGVERSAPVTVTTNCTPQGTVGAIGTYSVTPGKAGNAVFKVALAAEPGLNVETDCVAAKHYQGCIVARRAVNFVAQHGLTVPVRLSLICKGIECTPTSTCNRAGQCVPSTVDQASCDPSGVCRELVALESGGLVCGLLDASHVRRCQGDESWCTVSATGEFSCTAEPGVGGVSYACRDSRDCGGGNVCVASQGPVVGRCVSAVAPTDVELCTLGQPATPCSSALACEIDAGPGLFSCSSLRPEDAGSTVGLPCPRGARLHCSGATPYCDELTDPPTCSATRGAQCWYASDCDGGVSSSASDAGTDAGVKLFCFAGLDGGFKNVCSPAATASNAVAVCGGAPGTSECPSGQLCLGQLYSERACSACPTSRGDCNAQPLDGCETDLSADVNNCGACGHVCSTVNGTASCLNGVCQIACTPGFENCDGYNDNGCELQTGASCRAIGDECRVGRQVCATTARAALCDFDGGVTLDAGAACGMGGQCDAVGLCHCAPSGVLNGQCALDATCDPMGICRRNWFWGNMNKTTATSRSGHSFCPTDAGFTAARLAWGYDYHEVGGPSGSHPGAGCLAYSADRQFCTRWSTFIDNTAVDPNRIFLQGDAGDPNYLFHLEAIDYLHNGGVDVRVDCRY